MSAELDDIDRSIINALQGGFPLVERPFAAAAEPLGISEAELIDRVRALRESGVLSRFGPLYNADRMGGGFCLCAIAVPPSDFDAVNDKVNAFREVAHNYERGHKLNMWFVVATEKAERVGEVIKEIEEAIGLTVHAFPKEKEFFIEFKVAV